MHLCSGELDIKIIFCTILDFVTSVKVVIRGFKNLNYTQKTFFKQECTYIHVFVYFISAYLHNC